MQIDKQSMVEMAGIVAEAVVMALEKKNVIGTDKVGKTENANAKMDKTAYQKTEQLLYNYNGFKRIVDERMQEIEDIRAHGVPQKCGAVGERVCNGNLPQGIVLPDESVENAVHRIHCALEPTVQAIALIDKCMASMSKDPYYDVLRMFYFEGRTQEDIAVAFNCSQVNISKTKSRLVRELAMRIFPNQVMQEMMN